MTRGIGAFTGMARRCHAPLRRCDLRSIQTICPIWTPPLWVWGVLTAAVGPSTVLHLSLIRSVLVDNAGLLWKVRSYDVQTADPCNCLESLATSASARRQNSYWLSVTLNSNSPARPLGLGASPSTFLPGSSNCLRAAPPFSDYPRAPLRYRATTSANLCIRRIWRSSTHGGTRH